MKKLLQLFFIPYSLFIISFSLFTIHCFAQDDLMNLISRSDSSKSKINYTSATFKSTRVVLGQSVEIPAAGNLLFVISHHFGTLNEGPYNLWGLDQANIRFGFEYSITRRLCIGFGRSTFDKTYDGSLKYILLKQSTGRVNIPLTVTLFADMTVNSLNFTDPERTNYFTSRLAYVYEILIARKFTENLSLQLTPSMIHKNLVPLSTDHNDLYAIGFSGRYKITKRLTFNAEYFYEVPKRISGTYYNSFSLGVDIDTGGHIFQIFLTKSDPMFEEGFITETSGTWNKGYIQLGFNITRMFTINKVDSSKKWE